jgi:hypothetical protein
MVTPGAWPSSGVTPSASVESQTPSAAVSDTTSFDDAPVGICTRSGIPRITMSASILAMDPPLVRQACSGPRIWVL